MTKAAAIHSFFSSFGIPAYVATSVPNTREVEMPYLTYQYIMSGFTGGAVFPTVQLWYKTTSEAIPNAKAEEIYNAIGEGHVIPCDGGYIKFEHGSPFMVCDTAADDTTIKLRQLNIMMTYYTM